MPLSSARLLLVACSLSAVLVACASGPTPPGEGWGGGGAAAASGDANTEQGERGLASWYGAQHHGKRTASGEPFDMRALTAAHKTLPFGTRVRVLNPANGASVVVRINDRGPFTPGRVIDLSRAAAERIGLIRAGVAPVVVFRE
ncbi:MAG: septal ring lytic transglycosylase RlpA family protein [Hydrogenophaga sp.]|nr:septal ring lytic transglycosylase RlpA family protein [Hydrogenophaga sp.]